MRASARELLARLEAEGFVVAHDGERLLVAPRERLTDELRAAIREHRDYLLALLRERALGFATPPRACPACGYCGFYERPDGTWGVRAMLPVRGQALAGDPPRTAWGAAPPLNAMLGPIRFTGRIDGVSVPYSGPVPLHRPRKR